MKEKLNILRSLSAQKASVEKQLKCGIIDIVDATNELSMIDKKERKIIKDTVLATHVTRDGKPRKITYQESKDLYYTLMPDKEKIYAATLDGLYLKLFEAYGFKRRDTSLEGVFKAALELKANTENNSEQTISHYEYDFKRFISEELAHTDIAAVTKTDLQRYTQEMVKSQRPKKKAFMSYKGVLNLVFGYAFNEGLISVNPVSYIKNSVYYKSCDIQPAKSEDKILTEEEIQRVRDTVRARMKQERYKGYFINGYAILLATETGMRAAEICSLRWDDISTYIHIHSQQLSRKCEGKKCTKEYYYANWTKDEKGIPNGGRKYPVTNNIRAILGELLALQKSLGIRSKYVFCHKNGEWIKTDAYETCLRRLMSGLGYNVTNNHSFRMSLNSNVFIGKYGLPATERARLLGHSVETNLRYYSFAGKDSLDDICAILNEEIEVSPRSHQNIVTYTNEKSSRTAYSQAF